MSSITASILQNLLRMDNETRILGYVDTRPKVTVFLGALTKMDTFSVGLTMHKSVFGTFGDHRNKTVWLKLCRFSRDMWVLWRTWHGTSSMSIYLAQLVMTDSFSFGTHELHPLTNLYMLLKPQCTILLCAIF